VNIRGEKGEGEKGRGRKGEREKGREGVGEREWVRMRVATTFSAPVKILMYAIINEALLFVFLSVFFVNLCVTYTLGFWHVKHYFTKTEA